MLPMQKQPHSTMFILLVQPLFKSVQPLLQLCSVPQLCNPLSGFAIHETMLRSSIVATHYLVLVCMKLGHIIESCIWSVLMHAVTIYGHCLPLTTNMD